jgi:hypothetical protein
MKNSTRTVLAVALGLTWSASDAHLVSAQGITSGRVVELRQRGIEFDDPVKACLRLCSRLVVERQTFDCRPYLVTTDRCDLPWIDPSSPNPDWSGQGSACVPEKGEVGGYHLEERVEQVEIVTTQGADCQAMSSEMVLQVLPDRGNPPRSCPGPGAWTSEDERIVSIQLFPCR